MVRKWTIQLNDEQNTRTDRYTSPKKIHRDFLAVQWLRFCATTARSTGSIWSSVPDAMQWSKNKTIKRGRHSNGKQVYERCHASYVFREFQILNNSEIPLHTYWNGQIPKYWQHQMVVRMWNKRNCHLLLAEKQNGTATLGDSLAICYKTEHVLTIWSSSHTPWYLPKGIESLCPHKNLHMDVYSSFVHNWQNLEPTMSFSRW